MKNLYLAQVARKNNGDWDGFRAHQYDAYTDAEPGDIVDMPWGERCILTNKQPGAVFLDGDYTDEELEDDANIVPAMLYTFACEDGVYHSQFYMGDMYMYDYPTINEYHKDMYPIDPNSYDIGGYFETSEPQPDMYTVKEWLKQL